MKLVSKSFESKNTITFITSAKVYTIYIIIKISNLDIHQREKEYYSKNISSYNDWNIFSDKILRPWEIIALFKLQIPPVFKIVKWS